MSRTGRETNSMNEQTSANYSRRSSSSSSSSTKSAASSVETTITKLLISTKHLLQTLTQWSRRAVNERAVSDAYVQLGNDFKVVSKVFGHCGVDVSDLGDVPMDLRKVLEAALKEKPSDENLNKYLPTIREIIVTLLDKLKVKQALLKTIKQDQLMRRVQHQQRPSVVSSLSLSAIPPQGELPTSKNTASPYKSKTAPNSVVMSTNPTPQIPIGDSLSPQAYIQERTLSENEALSQLKKSSNLQRRASKRFSAYHMAKLTNQSTTEAATAAALATSTQVSHRIPSIPALASPESTTALASQSSSSADHDNQTSISHDKDSKAKCLTLFLCMNGKTKKCVAPTPMNINALRLLFVEKFAYSPGGNSFPDMYIKDENHSVFYELEEQEMHEIREGSVIELRQSESGTEMSKIDVSKIMETIKIQISKNHDDILKNLNNIVLSSQEKLAAVTAGKQPQPQLKKSNTNHRVSEIKHELATLKLLHVQNNENAQSALGELVSKLEAFRTLSMDTSSCTNKTYIEKSQIQLGEVSDHLLSRVDDLQDLIETLRKDVAIRGARPSKKKLDSVQKELKSAQDDLEKMKEFIGSEKPHWKTIWERELDKVCEEQQFLTLQEDLTVDLGEDLGRARETFDLVNMCCVEQEKNPKKNKTNPILPIPKPGELKFAREQLLMDVQALNPDHDGRVEALEKAEKIWEKERGYRDNDEFEDELESFVENASFKRLGGVKEVERLRRQKDEENLRANFAPLDF